ncbi:MAG TPA: ABC transporter substrate-binding protein [Acidimicrobiales bacterium]|nr:ABC transporter substrate-binding protein [Acidimicrobiales bacterium]
MVIAATAVAAACSSGSGSKGSTATTKGATGVSSGPTTTAAPSFNPNGILKYGYDFSAQFSNIDPGKSQSPCSAIVTAPIFDTLIHRDINGKLQPGLATSWDTTVNPNTVTLHLRSGVTFSDGEAFDANAVKTGMLHNKTNTQFSDLQPMTSVDVIDPMTVRLNFTNDQPPVAVLYSLSEIEGEIVAPNHIADASTNPVGAGPMQFVSFSPGSSLVEKANPSYWGKQDDPWHIGGVTFTQVSVGPPEVTALKSGAVDIVAIQPSDYASIKGNSAYGINTQSATDYLQFQFRFTPPFDNVNVRKAVEFAINKAQINQVVQSGLGEVATQPFAKNSPAYDPSLANLYPYDPAKAKAALAAAGLPLPIKVQMAIPGGNIASMADQGAIIQQNLDAVGFDVSIIPIPGNAIASDYYIGGKGNAFAAQRPGEPYPPVQIADQWSTGQFVAKYSKGERPDVTSIINNALNAGTADQVFGLTKQALDIVMNQALDVPIAFSVQVSAYNNSRVGGQVYAQTGVCDIPIMNGIMVKS